MKNNVSMKLPVEFWNFLRRLKANRIRADKEEDIISHIDACMLLVKYFKLNNDTYIDLVNMERDND